MAGTLRGGSREDVGEELGLSGIRSGLGKSDFLDNNDLPRTVRSRTIGSQQKNRETRARTIRILYRAARNPLLQEGAGGGPERDCRVKRKSPAKRRPPHAPIPGKTREIPSQKFTIPPRLVNGFSASYCKPARKKFPKKLDKGGWGLYLCRWENSLQRSG